MDDLQSQMFLFRRLRTTASEYRNVKLCFVMHTSRMFHLLWSSRNRWSCQWATRCRVSLYFNFVEEQSYLYWGPLVCGNFGGCKDTRMDNCNLVKWWWWILSAPQHCPSFWLMIILSTFTLLPRHTKSDENGGHINEITAFDRKPCS